jgi:hypothetical protein
MSARRSRASFQVDWVRARSCSLDLNDPE